MATTTGDVISENGYNRGAGHDDLKVETPKTTKPMSDTQTEAWTNQKLLRWTTEFFTNKELDSPRLAAEVLLAAALDCRRIDLYARFNDVPVEPELGTFRGWVKRHGAGEPVAYLVGYKEFYSLRFEVNHFVLIPRPETEHVVMAALDCVKSMEGQVQIADVGTGSGCIAVTLATQIKNANLVATDLSSEALKVAQNNAILHDVMDQVNFVESDLLAALPVDQTFDVIVSNPPYVGRNEVGTLEENVAAYEPELALFGGDEGTEIIARLIDEASERLRPGGFLIIEFSPMIAAACKDLVDANPSYESCEIQKDFSQLQRLLVAKKAS